MKDNKTQIQSNKKFGTLFVLIFLFLSLYSYYLSFFLTALILILISIILASITKFKASKLDTLHRFWIQFGLFLNKIISPIVMALIFYILITPVSLISYISGRDELGLKKKDKKTYWKEKKYIKSYESSFNNQF